jgi:hypothetical protein
MSMSLPLVSKIVVLIVGSFLLSFLWWNVWMYQGFIGPIPFLHWFIIADGEFSYDLTQYEMFAQLIVVIELFIVVASKAKSNAVAGEATTIQVA